MNRVRQGTKPSKPALLGLQAFFEVVSPRSSRSRLGSVQSFSAGLLAITLAPSSTGQQGSCRLGPWRNIGSQRLCHLKRSAPWRGASGARLAAGWALDRLGRQLADSWWQSADQLANGMCLDFSISPFAHVSTLAVAACGRALACNGCLRFFHGMAATADPSRVPILEPHSCSHQCREPASYKNTPFPL